MTYGFLIGKTAEIQHACAVALAKWLEWWLPKVSKQWWDKCVVAHLTDERQRRVCRSIDDLDLAALLKVLSKNRNALLGRGLLQAIDRTTIDLMFEVRNRWAHLTSQMPPEEVIIRDLGITSSFLMIIAMGNKSKELRRNVADFIAQLKENGITDKPADIPQTQRIQNKTAVPLEQVVTDDSIRIQSIVRLKSNPQIRGVVIGVENVDGKAKYNVFVNNEARTFYDGQIELDWESSLVRPAKDVTVDELRRRLTALYINRPSSGSLYSLGAAKIDFVPYQFRPALKLLRSDVPRLLIADSVGVGKTIEAGLILKELQARSQMRNVLIVCPRPLVAERKWENEMRDKFGEEFTPVDGGGIRYILDRCNKDGVWPDKYRYAILPNSLLSSELMDGFKREHLTGLEKLDPAPHFDLVIVDEAHHIRNSGTQIYRAVKYFCDHADAAVFLTATPIQLGDNDLFTLLNVLFPNDVIDKPTFMGMTAPNEHIHSAVRCLRLGEEHNREAVELLQKAADTPWGRSVISSNSLYSQILSTLNRGKLSREERVRVIDSVESLNGFSRMINRTRRIDIEKDAFCIRDAITLRSEFAPHQQRLHDAVIDFEARVLRTLHGGKNVNFMLSTLRQQAASCIYGLAPSIEALAQRGVKAIIDGFDGDTEPELGENEIKAIVESAADLIELSKNLEEKDTKLENLLEIIQNKQRDHNNKIIMFSIFRPTQSYLERKIKELTKLRVGKVNGDTKDRDRYDMRDRFARDKNNPEALDILLFTEVGSEGLDYQFCDTMVNYDLPWNPMRIEQRIGRIDRRGQKSEKVHIYNCITEGTLDAVIFDRCLNRIGIFEKNIGDCGDILGRLAKSIDEIVFSSNLTEAERNEKIERLAENEARNLVEIQKLEDESKALFGIDMSDFTESLNRADNPWLSANAIRRLIDGYLEQRLKDGKKHIDGKKLSLSADVKQLIKEDYNNLNLKDKRWAGFLQDTSTSSRHIYFEQTEAVNDNDEKSIFVNTTHALTRQAAKFFSNNVEMQIALSVENANLSSGTYPFSLYSWEYQNERPRIELTPVCENEPLREELLDLVQSAVQVELRSEEYSDRWKLLETQHHKLWSAARDKFRAVEQDLCNSKLESLRSSKEARLRIAETRGIESIKEGEIANIKAEYDRKTTRLKEVADRADIHSTRVLNGVITVIGGQ